MLDLPTHSAFLERVRATHLSGCWQCHHWSFCLCQESNWPFFWNREGFSAGRLLCGPQIGWDLGLWIWVFIPLLAADPAECGSSTTPVFMQFRYSQPLQLFSFCYFGLFIILVTEPLQELTAILWYATCSYLWTVIFLHSLCSYIPI